MSVVTFLAVAFLFLSTRERGAVTTTLDMTTARLAAEAATERAKVVVIAGLISSNSAFNYDLIVSTNYINAIGFVPGSTGLTNVNYDYLNDGSANFTLNDRLQNIANLFYGARPPVFPGTNRGPAFYLDLNRNGRFETNGVLPVLSGIPGLPFYDTNGVPMGTIAGNTAFNHYVGDPEWIGLLERADRAHSSSNKFKSRIAYILVPEGRTLDVNHMHNQAKLPGNALSDGFSRNLGFGTWELNMASFLVDLNTNVWQGNPGVLPYGYNINAALPSTGTAFEDALGMFRWRTSGWNNQRSVSALFGVGNANVFAADGADGYGDGPLSINTAIPLPVADTDPVNLGWPGADGFNHFFTTQDFFDRAKTFAPGQVAPNTFSDRLRNIGINGISSYDRYTYYRMLSQLGTDSGPEPAGKIHVNYVNVDAAGTVIPDMQTNFIPWQALQFFTNAADRMLKATFIDTNYNYQNFGIMDVDMKNLPVYVSNRFVYTPSIHRILQVAGNIHDASSSYTDGTFSNFPSVFQPIFIRRPNWQNASLTDVFIAGYKEVIGVADLADPQVSVPLDMKVAAEQALIPVEPAAPLLNQNVYGVPWVIGAKKGFPNFNEFSMQTVVQTTRKLQVRRVSTASGVKPSMTNQLFLLSVSNMFAFEAWNSYSSDYGRSIEIHVANDMLIGLAMTNDAALDPRGNAAAVRLPLYQNSMPIPANGWKGYGPRISDVRPASFKIPLRANFTYLTNSHFRTIGGPHFNPIMKDGPVDEYGFEQDQGFHIPQFNLSVSNRIRFIMIDTQTRRVIDYVQLGDLAKGRNLSHEIAPASITIQVGGPGVPPIRPDDFWNTNRGNANALSTPPGGVIHQINISSGLQPISDKDWDNYNMGSGSRLKEVETAAFARFLNGDNTTDLAMQAPFTPTAVYSVMNSWQANDPLVHYTSGDLQSEEVSMLVNPPGGQLEKLQNITNLNTRFEPWGGNPTLLGTPSRTVDKHSVQAKDPGVTTSDKWDFSTNKFASLGMLGRVHRGTPWQTLYLKAGDIDNARWARWTGNNTNAVDAAMTKPAIDRRLFDALTVAVNADATRGQLNVNQTNLAAWSAALGGLIGLTNTGNPSPSGPSVSVVAPFIIEPAGIAANNSTLKIIHDGINRTRSSKTFNGVFRHTADVFATPELSVASPLLKTNTPAQLKFGINDATYERLPQMLLGLLRGNDQPRFSIYAYGQTLRPAPRSIITAGGPHFGLCTNYQVTAEFATRTVVRIEGAPGAPRAVVESFNILPPD